MKLRQFVLLLLVLSVFLIPGISKAGVGPPFISFTLPESDGIDRFDAFSHTLFFVFDLRERDTFIQVTYPDQFMEASVHVQIFDVSNNCNENNFFDLYTPTDTHVYNLRDIQTNDGNPSGVILPDNSYGIVAVDIQGIFQGRAVSTGSGLGNVRIVDNSGYEYRTNAVQMVNTRRTDAINENIFYSFNFNSESGVSLSDIYGITVQRIPLKFPGSNPLLLQEWAAANVQDVFSPFDIDIYDLNEVPFSCRDIVFSCVNNANPLLEGLLEISGKSVASFDYGINNSIPHSRGGELLCPGNVISDGAVVLTPEIRPGLDIGTNDFAFFGFAGLNNGNGRGSFDSIWLFNYPQENLPINNF